VTHEKRSLPNCPIPSTGDLNKAIGTNRGLYPARHFTAITATRPVVGHFAFFRPQPWLHWPLRGAPQKKASSLGVIHLDQRLPVPIILMAVTTPTDANSQGCLHIPSNCPCRMGFLPREDTKMIEVPHPPNWEDRRVSAKLLVEVNSRIQRLLHAPNERQPGGWGSLMQKRAELVKRLSMADK
jgi:hypothetical protein